MSTTIGGTLRENGGGTSTKKDHHLVEDIEEHQDDHGDDDVIQPLAPSHILQDGRFIQLPAPTDRERVRFFERSIARHRLLEDYLSRKPRDSDAVKKEEEDDANESEEGRTKNKEQPQIHPLALASAKLQADGINELNRAINLQMLASSADYFGLSNIVDPSLELVTAATSTGTAGAGTSTSETSKTDSDKKKDSAVGATGQTISAAEKYETECEMLQEQRMKASFILKRKRFQLDHAGKHILRRHRRRLAAAIVAQSLPDRRLKELRPFWRLVAPEHGSRAAPHPARPTEVVAADVDVYYRKAGEGATALGRLARLVPRYATMELQEDYKVHEDLKIWKEKYVKNSETKKRQQETGDSEKDMQPKEKVTSDRSAMEIDVTADDGITSTTTKHLSTKIWTRAEPFAIADPALGKLDADFDPNKVQMLTLRLDIEKPATGYVQSACLEPFTSGTNTNDETVHHQEDENLLVSLQHSLFCAKLFESIRRELAPDTEDIGQIRTTARQSVAWLSGQSEENYLPPPSLMCGDRKTGFAPLCVVHVHEGDAKVLLDCEYALRIRLVETEAGRSKIIKPLNGGMTSSGNEGPNRDFDYDRAISGSQSPAQLLAVCHALLLHSQETYHRHSVFMENKLRKEEEQELKEMATTKLTPHQLQQRQQAKMNKSKKESTSSESPRILASCVSLGTKMLFERRIRMTLRRVKEWIQRIKKSNDETDDKFIVQWLPLSIFDLSAHFTVSFQYWAIDATIVGDELTVTQFSVDGSTESDDVAESGSDIGCYRKAKFHTDKQFELFLKMALRKVMPNTAKTPS